MCRCCKKFQQNLFILVLCERLSHGITANKQKSIAKLCECSFYVCRHWRIKALLSLCYTQPLGFSTISQQNVSPRYNKIPVSFHNVAPLSSTLWNVLYREQCVYVSFPGVFHCPNIDRLGTRHNKHSHHLKQNKLKTKQQQCCMLLSCRKDHR